MEHVEIHGCSRGEQFVEVARARGGGGGVVHTAPPVEPAVPELGAHQRARGLVPAERREAFGAARPERRRQVCSGGAAVAQHVRLRLIDGGQRHGDPGLARDPHQLGEVGYVAAVGAVFVLDLHEHDRAVAVDLPGRDDVVDAPQVVHDRLQVAGVTRTWPHIAHPGEPYRQAAVVPLGADVGAGSHDRVHPLVGDDVEEGTDVERSGLFPPAAHRFVGVPGDVRLDGVQPHETRLAHAVTPLVGVHAEVVDRAREDAVGLTVEQKVGVADLERRHRCVVPPARRGQTPRTRRSYRFIAAERIPRRFSPEAREVEPGRTGTTRLG